MTCRSFDTLQDCHTGWLRLVGSLKLQVSFAEYRLFYRALLQKRPVILTSLLIVATPYTNFFWLIVALLSRVTGLFSKCQDSFETLRDSHIPLLTHFTTVIHDTPLARHRALFTQVRALFTQDKALLITHHTTVIHEAPLAHHRALLTHVGALFTCYKALFTHYRAFWPHHRALLTYADGQKTDASGSWQDLFCPLWAGTWRIICECVISYSVSVYCDIILSECVL